MRQLKHYKFTIILSKSHKALFFMEMIIWQDIRRQCDGYFYADLLEVVSWMIAFLKNYMTK